MRVLWFTGSISNFQKGIHGYNGCGWITSLETELQKRKEVQLGIAFFLNGQPEKVDRDGRSYYPIANPYRGSIISRLRYLLSSSHKRQDYFIKTYLNVINDFQPEIIHIFGTEQNFGLIALHTHVPIVIHLQGLLTPILTAFFPPSYSLRQYVMSDYLPWKMLKRWRRYVYFRKNTEVEKQIFRYNLHFMGRTQWDRNITSIYSPTATYNYCSEILREVFYEPSIRKLPDRLIISTTISSLLYKGFDMVLKCAKLMKEQMKLDFEWRVFGNVDPKIAEKKEKICLKDVSVKLMGVASPNELKQSIIESTLYVHPSYIENSPNSVCEAQMLGCTVVAQNVGGMSSIVSHGETGFLVPANDPYQMACVIRYLFYHPSENEEMGHRSAEIAHKRHDKDQIIDDLLGIYNKYLLK